jgi:hypothetical protein
LHKKYSIFILLKNKNKTVEFSIFSENKIQKIEMWGQQQQKIIK